ncbi:MAG TPA: hypothetical protein DC049_06495, partial [Spirochaetia bacterium]|nr:hypothetical protein [Spirochaetia bacterium]
MAMQEKGLLLKIREKSQFSEFKTEKTNIFFKLDNKAFALILQNGFDSGLPVNYEKNEKISSVDFIEKKDIIEQRIFFYAKGHNNPIRTEFSYSLFFSDDIELIGDYSCFSRYNDQKDWLVMDVSDESIYFDISDLVLDAPAGKYGPVT